MVEGGNTNSPVSLMCKQLQLLSAPYASTLHTSCTSHQNRQYNLSQEQMLGEQWETKDISEDVLWVKQWYRGCVKCWFVRS